MKQLDYKVSKHLVNGNSRELAIKIVDHCLARMGLGMTSSDLPDSPAFCNGVDGIQDNIDSGDCTMNDLIRLGNEVVDEMIADL
jgi:hypothetical protein